MTHFRTQILVIATRRLFRSSEGALIGLAIGVGLVAGLATLLQSGIAHFMQRLLYGLDVARLSAETAVSPWSLVALPAGGLALAWFTRVMRSRNRAPIDVVEANALHGGAIPMHDSLTVSGQTMLSNGAGASVGLEAAYAQIGGGIASVIGQWLRLRRNDMRVLVGAGAGAAVGAAFGAPLTGAFYAFEIVIGAYTPAAIAPVAAAALSASLVVRASHAPVYLIAIPSAHAIRTVDYFLFGALGIFCSLIGIILIQTVTLVEIRVRRSSIPDFWRPVVGGLLLMPIAWVSPQALSAGHGALHIDLTARVTLSFLVLVFLLKILASTISLGFGFRGGLFFASLFLGSLAGQIFADLINMVPGATPVDATDAALVGMAAMAVAVVGGPMTMSMLVLESTHDFALTAVAITAALCSGTIARETFGFSFSTWRLHTRGETIRSARDVGWVKTLTAGRMMRRGVPTVDPATSINEFRRRFPLGSTSRIVLASSDDRYEGVVTTSAAYAPGVDGDAEIASLAGTMDCTVRPEDNIAIVMKTFEEREVDDLVVVDPERRVLGVLSEKYVRRRYTEEVEKAYRDLFGE